MRTLVESILDNDFDVHDEAVFTDQIIPEIRDHTQLMLQAFLKEMVIKIENGKRILYVGGKNSFLAITDKITQILEEYNIHEVRSGGTLVITGDLTEFVISAPNVSIGALSKDLHLTKCNITCDALLINGDNRPSVQCNQCKIKTKIYWIHRTPIEFVSSKIIGLDSIYIIWKPPISKIFNDLGVGHSLFDGFYPYYAFDKKISHFDPLKELANIKTISKSPNIYLYYSNAAAEEHRAGMIFKSPRTPIDKRVEKATTYKLGAYNCANGYEAFFMDTK